MGSDGPDAPPRASDETLPPSLPGAPAAQGAQTLPPSLPGGGTAAPARPIDVTAPTLAGGASLPAPMAVGEFPVARWERYEFLGKLGQGGMGAVYKARDRRLGRVVALKFILGADPSLAMRFLQEARAQARIDHPNVCKVFEVGEVNGRAYIAMQFVDGERLDKAAARMTLDEKVRVLRDVALAMHEAHRLGVVHRDLKPANILVEQREDGARFPVVMDFGLAREATADQGLTESGALLGTPSYMAPEQARGDARAIDRRADVYSLGATLYELLAGRPPFSHPALAVALHMVINSDPPSLRGQVPALPADLETIALKCLEKEPERRYASARALAEDLSRYLDGEPILGRRASLTYRLKRRAERNRAAFAVGGVSLLLIAGLAGYGVRAGIQARVRAELARRLGQDVKEIEWFLRVVEQLPLHDTRPERALIRDRMAKIAAEAHDDAGRALAQYAIGRGHLALHEPAEAAQAFARASQAGLDTPELHYAHGRALGELYRRAMALARRSGDPAWQARRQKELEEQLLQPALAALEKSRARGLSLESPELLEALIAFDRGDTAEAARHAAAATQQAPWLAEARRLMADVALAGATAELARGAYDAAQAAFEHASALYGETVEIARSDASAHLAEADAWLGRADLAFQKGGPQREALRHALDACDRAVRASPEDGGAYTARAYALLRYYRAVDVFTTLVDRLPVLEDWRRTAARATELAPGDALAWDALGNAHLYRGFFESHRGDPEPHWDAAIAAFTRALAVEPNNPWAQNDLGVVHRWRGSFREEHGQDPRPSYREAAACYERAATMDPTYLAALSNMIDLHCSIAGFEASIGADPSAAVEDAREAGERCLRINPNHAWTFVRVAQAELVLAEHQLRAGGDPSQAVARSLERLDRAGRTNPNDIRLHYYGALGSRLLAEHAIAHGGDGAAEAQAAERALGLAWRIDAACVECFVESALLKRLRAGAMKDRRAAAATLAGALADARRAASLEDPSSEAHEAIARVQLAITEADAGGGPTRTKAIDDGLVHADRALALNPRSAQAHATRGRLLLARGDAGAARAALARAIEINPVLKREYGRDLERAEGLLGGH